MATCLGISVGKNLIKYAKMIKDKNSTNIVAYGIKFYDIMSNTITEIISETKSKDAAISVSVTSDEYCETEAFRDMKKKDMQTYIETEFAEICNKRSLSIANLDMRYILADHPTNAAQYRVICMCANKMELSNIWKALNQYKVKSISGIGSSIATILPNKGKGTNALVVNIEDDTKCTIVKEGVITQVISIPVGMDEVITKLADRYNSYAKAYEACKGIDAYADTDMGAPNDQDTKYIRDALMPVLYELKQRLMYDLDAYQSDFKEIYFTGTGIVVNNIDLYLSDAFPGKHTEILILPYANKDVVGLKDVVEVNSALAAATYYLNGIKREEDFLVSGDYLKNEANKVNFTPKALFTALLDKVDEINKSTLKVKKSSKRKTNISFDDEIANMGESGGVPQFNAQIAEDDLEYYDPMAEWFTRVSIGLFVGWIAYTYMSWYIGNNINDRLKEVENNIQLAEMEIQKVEQDKEFIVSKSKEYNDKITNLEHIIRTIRDKKDRSYNVPNFLSQLMFVIPDNVKVESIQIDTDNSVVMEVTSPKYAQLGYFVSRLKLAGIITNVNMEVLGMSSSISIKISGRLP